MISRKRKLAIAISSAAALLAVGTPVVLAAGDTDDSISPAKTLVKSNLKTGTASVLKGTVDGIAVTLTCKVSTVSFTTPATGLGPVNTTTPPTFKSCTDSAGGTDTVTTNQTNGHWTVTFVDAPNDEAKEGADHVRIGIPKAGATIKTSVLAGCVITVAPTKAATITGAYNDVNTLTITNAVVPTSGSGCTTGASGTQSSTYVSSPKFHDVS